MFVKRFVFRCTDHPNLIFFGLIFTLFTASMLYSPVVRSSTTMYLVWGENANMQDTVRQKKTTTDDINSHQNSQVFYDTVYKKLSRNKLTQLLYGLAFVVPKQSDLPDTLQVLKSASPFEKFQGKIIRNIQIKILPPFGASVYDTGRQAVTGVGKSLNSVHMNTRKYVIRRNLLFKKGERVIPAILADNERLLRNMSAIDNARIIVNQAGSGSDSVDLVVIAKDVWSIGFDVPLITLHKVRFRVYDANFVGLGDQLTTTMSLDLYRAPFFLFEGLSYTYSNIGGSLINATIGYTDDDSGNENMVFRLDRSFLTNLTKWAGGIYVSVDENVNNLLYKTNIKTYSNNEGLWIGLAFLLKGQKETSRAVISGAVYRKYYTSRPFITIDSNRNYYNNLQTLATLSVSRNNYYMTDYVLDFGKTENLSYGHLFQFTIGMDQCDFYTRLYSGVNISAGNFFNKFGYISAYVKLGGFFNHSSFEDAVVKFNLHYFTPLLKTSRKNYKFRAFYTVDYRYAFNSRSNNLDYFDANLNFEIDKVNTGGYFYGMNVVSGRLSTVCFTPWYFYGFRFALMMELQTGLVAQKKEPLYKSRMFSSIGFSVIIKNDNLVFPAFLLSGYYYPTSVENFRQLQFTLSSNLHIQYYDFNVMAPHEENLVN
ncbi:MAG: hypothetical protein WCK09_11090 [Bacteroidota bacterium]